MKLNCHYCKNESTCMAWLDCQEPVKVPVCNDCALNEEHADALKQACAILDELFNRIPNKYQESRLKYLSVDN